MKKVLATLLALTMLMGCVSFAAAEEAASDVIELSVVVAAKVDHGDWNNFWALDTIEKECGIRFKVTQYSEEAWKEKKGILFASEELPDVFIGDGALTDEDLANYGGQGYLLPLEDYMTEEQIPSVYAVMEEIGNPDLLKGMTFPDGHIYAFRGVNGSLREYATNRYFINTQWAENLGVKVPETLDEFYNYLVAVRDGDPNGNGDTTDEIPISGLYDDYRDHFIPILTAFGFLDRRLQPDENGQVQYVPVQPNYKEFLKFMNKLYTEGLIDSTYFTQTKDQFNAKQAEGKIASFTDYAQWQFNNDPEFYLQYETPEPYTSDYNSEKMWPAKDAIYYGSLVITSNVTDQAVIDRLIAFADWCYSPKGTDLLWNGPALGMNEENPQYGYYFVPFSMDDPSYLVRKSLYPTESYDSNSKYLTDKVKPGNSYWPYASIPSRESNADPTSTSYNLSMNINTHQAPYYKVGIPATMKYTPEEAEEISLIVTDLDSYIATMESKMIVGELDIEENFDTFVKGCEDRGLAQYLELVQAAYDRYMGK